MKVATNGDCIEAKAWENNFQLGLKKCWLLLVRLSLAPEKK
jgi:hypothetical protein